MPEITTENYGFVREIVEYITHDLELDQQRAAPQASILLARLLILQHRADEAESEALERPTWERKYIAGEGNDCPICGAEGRLFPILPIFANPHDVTIAVLCNACNRIYTERYKIVGVELLEE